MGYERKSLTQKFQNNKKRRIEVQFPGERWQRGRRRGDEGVRERRGCGWSWRSKEEDGFACLTVAIAGHCIARGWTKKRSYSSEISSDLPIKRSLVTFVGASSLG